MLVGKPPTRLEEILVQMSHHEVDGSAVRPTHEAAVGVPTDIERQRGMMVVVEGTEALVPHDMESKSLCDPLNGEVAELLQFVLFHQHQALRFSFQEFVRLGVETRLRRLLYQSAISPHGNLVACTFHSFTHVNAESFKL